MRYEPVEHKVARILQEARTAPRLKFVLNERFVHVLVDNCEYKLLLKFSGDPNPRSIDYHNTHQYRAMTALGFITSNGASYNYNKGIQDVWVHFKNSRIVKITHFLEETDILEFEMVTNNVQKL